MMKTRNKVIKKTRKDKIMFIKQKDMPHIVLSIACFQLFYCNTIICGQKLSLRC